MIFCILSPSEAYILAARCAVCSAATSSSAMSRDALRATHLSTYLHAGSGTTVSLSSLNFLTVRVSTMDSFSFSGQPCGAGKGRVRAAVTPLCAWTCSTAADRVRAKRLDAGHNKGDGPRLLAAWTQAYGKSV